MKKFLSLLRNRYFIAISVILLELLEFMVLFYLIYFHFWPIIIVSIIAGVLVLLYLIDKDGPLEIKLPWVFITLFVPIVGPFLYIFFNNDTITRRLEERYLKHIKTVSNYTQDTGILDEIKKDNSDAYMQARYILTNKELSLYDNSKVTYLETGEKFYTTLIEDLKKANKFIFLEYFVVSEGFMLDTILDILKYKAKTGVEVYFLYDDFGSMKHLTSSFYKDIERYNIHSIPSNKIVPQLSKIHNNRDHRKITVIDGIIGYTGGANIADEYINRTHPYGYWKDASIKIEGDAVKNFTKMFIGSWNIQHKDDHLDYAKFLNVESPSYIENGYIIPYAAGPRPFYTENYGKNVYLNLINEATNYVYITTPYLICDSEITNALRLAVKRGVDVRIVTPHIPDKKMIFLMTRSNYLNLVKDGVKIYEYKPGFLHSKLFVVDDIYATCGTINLDYRSLVHHFENGAWMYKCKCIKDIKNDIEEIISASIKITKQSAELKGITKLLAEIMKVFTPLL